MASDIYGDLIKSVIALLVVIDPIASVPVIMTLTSKMEKKNREHLFQTLLLLQWQYCSLFLHLSEMRFSQYLASPCSVL
ncbi:MAG: hypothetical protein KGI11_08810 [Thaumarchaeota archaeon]|nr:hypothetical protein [Nitrososphaerota archaeon]